MEDNRWFFAGVKAFIRRNEKLLIVRESERFDDGGKWELPGGKIGRNENGVPLTDILLREVSEECGHDLVIAVGRIFHAFRRRFANGDWVFLVGFLCEYESGEPVMSDEHEEFSWISLEDMKKYRFVNGYEEAIREYFSTVN